AVHNGEFFSNLMSRLGLSHEQSYCLAQASDSVFNVRKLRAGNAWSAYYSVTRENEEMQEKRLEYVVYGMDRVTDVVFKCVEPYRVWISEKPVETGRYTADVTINSSLWNDMRDAGVSPLLILQLSDIYAWTVDFFGLQKGDRFKVIYDMALCEGEAVAVDTVRYAVFEHAGTEYPAIMFNQGDGGNIYWNGNGESLRKAFLKAPLRYSRISSGFSYSRKHPVTRKVQPHTGIDYAAPAGTPVMTIGDGTVTSIGYEGAGGNVVRIRHNSVYSTAYLHLSKFASGLKVGQRVAQGDVIGYVGATGRCTGPHLDFRVWKNGSPVNPLKMESPPAEPLRTENKAAFDSLYIALREMWHDSQK
ncbi:MAG: peptidoglycan DD-metalloendopeptidase family protein, partial [Clostridium sp.]|nr:peptidoglycan DD-metalloendopeptidase family protein [Clostridium sp.]